MTSNNKTVSRHSCANVSPANVDRRPPLLLPLLVFLFVLYNKSLDDWSRGKQFILFPSAKILGKQNELFPLGPVMKCLLF